MVGNGTQWNRIQLKTLGLETSRSQAELIWPDLARGVPNLWMLLCMPTSV